MSKESKERKELRARLINEISKRYELSNKKYEERLNDISEKYHKLQLDNNNLRIENSELKSKIAQYEDWIDRMQDFCNMSESDRENYINYLKIKQETATNDSNLFKLYSSFLNIL